MLHAFNYFCFLLACSAPSFLFFFIFEDNPPVSSFRFLYFKKKKKKKRQNDEDRKKKREQSERKFHASTAGLAFYFFWKATFSKFFFTLSTWTMLRSVAIVRGKWNRFFRDRLFRCRFCFYLTTTAGISGKMVSVGNVWQRRAMEILWVFWNDEFVYSSWTIWDISPNRLQYKIQNIEYKSKQNPKKQQNESKHHQTFVGACYDLLRVCLNTK